MKENWTELFRPKIISDFIGQQHIINPNSFLIKAIKNKNLPHLFIYGSSGVGKTTLAYIIANELKKDFFNLNATSLSIKNIREIVNKYDNKSETPLIFIDEIHRLSKNQQEVLLPIMEFNKATIIGASTENLNFSLTAAIKSRGIIIQLYPLNKNDLELLLQKIINKFNLKIDNQAKEYLLNVNNGDARSLLLHLELCFNISKQIDLKLLKSIKQSNQTIIDIKDSSSTLMSALIKSIRGSDIDASIYYLILLIEKGEKPEYIARRLVILSSEDIGNANPNAFNLSVNTLQAVKEIGYPEAKLILTQTVIFLASCPKSNSVPNAIDNVYNYITQNSIMRVPYYLKNSSNDYKNPHNFGGYVKQHYLLKSIKFVRFKAIAFEKILIDWIEKIKKIGD